ncbi:28581_t:CDS:2 [Dentiscutata erythropus]|uniref:28581_t:CDS:1 n=1 Tax=Dentiscutata erythropus TaxID=1348616 RepID=A0A9N9HKB0_9GLOM|nr:28581_t:CDS:2 [Dentiscutata erythropus]
MTRVKPLTNITNTKNHNLRNRTIPINSSNSLKFKQPSSKTRNESLDQFFSIYNARLATSCDYFAWRILNEVELPIKDKRSETSIFLNTIKDLSKKEKWTLQEIENRNEMEEKCQSDKIFKLYQTSPRALVRWCEKIYNRSLKRKKILLDNRINGDRKKMEVFYKYQSLQNVPSQWIVRDVDGTIVDVGQAFVKTISWDEIRKMNYDHPVLSFIIDLTEPRRELCNILSPSVYSRIFRAPDDYYSDTPVEFKKIFSKFFNDRKNWDEDNFGKMENEDRQYIFYKFIRNVCRKLFEMWEITLNEDYCLEGTWHHQVLDPIFKEITKKIDGCFWNWGEACSLVSSFRKESYPRKPDFWLLQDINRTIQETVYEEASGSPFAPDQDKIKSDNFKLFRLGRDSKFKMDTQLISGNLEYLQDGEKLLQQIRGVEVVLFQAYETRLKVCIMDQLGFPLFRVRKVFDLLIPYKALNDEVFVLEFVHSLWLIRQNIVRNAMKLEEIGQSIRRNMQKAPVNPPGLSFSPNIDDYPTFPSP